MYKAKPRYSSFSIEFNIPENYRGNAFLSDEPKEEAIPLEASAESVDNSIEKAKEEPIAVSTQCKKSPLGLDLSRIFGGGIGSEELLILGLILLLKDGEDSDDIILLLALLLLMG